MSKVNLKLSKLRRKVLRDPKLRKRISSTLRKTWATPEARKVFVEGITKAMSSPKVRKKLSKVWKKTHIPYLLKYQRVVEKKLLKEGWTVTKRGWPDFICEKGTKVRFIEAKSPTGVLTVHQKHVHAILNKFGIKVEIVIP